MNKQQLASTIWQSANQMRSKIEANEYKDYILGFMFYKYLSNREVSFLKGEKYSDEDIKKMTANDEKLVKHISENIGYFIAYEDLFSTWLSKGDDFDVSDVRVISIPISSRHIRNCLKIFSRPCKAVFRS